MKYIASILVIFAIVPAAIATGNPSLRGLVESEDNHRQLQSKSRETSKALDKMSDWVFRQHDDDYNAAYVAIASSDNANKMSRVDILNHLVKDLKYKQKDAEKIFEDLFKKLDTDGNGTIEPKEYEKILRGQLGACYNQPNCEDGFVFPACVGFPCRRYLTESACYTELGGKSWRQGDENSDEMCWDFEGKTYGDPHFQTWSGEKYDFHGECDLVLIHNPGFADGLGMDIHIRTKIHTDWSAIESAAIQIGQDIFEVDGRSGDHWLNGNANVEFPTLLAGKYAVSMKDAGANTRRFSIGVGHLQKVRITKFKEFLAINVDNPTSKDFEGSIGLLGDFGSGFRVGRDGNTIIEDWNAFGQEWQVQSTEPKLFHEPDGPQHPEQCRMPTKVKDLSRRRLSGLVYTEAEKACSHVKGAEYNDCIFDVLATGDVEMAGAY